jgi:hypothetical protein
MALVPQGVGGSSVMIAYPMLMLVKYTGWAIKVQPSWTPRVSRRLWL